MTLTVWHNREATDRLGQGQANARIVRGILDRGVISENQQTEVFAFEGAVVGDLIGPLDGVGPTTEASARGPD